LVRSAGLDGGERAAAIQTVRSLPSSRGCARQRLLRYRGCGAERRGAGAG
jgi:hypothetical protein